MHKKIVYVFFLLCFLVIGILVGFNLNKGNIVNDQEAQAESSSVRSGGYKLISPLLECNLNQSVGQKEYFSLENDLRSLIKEKIDANQASDISVYIRDLNNGPWFGVGEDDKFAPASLLKLPVMMAYFKKAESEPDFLNKKIEFSHNFPLAVQNIKPAQAIEVGKSYSIGELVERMIEYSDNQALFLLEENQDSKFIYQTMEDLGLPIPTQSSPDGELSVKDYATLFRVLFNASYLNREFSEKALEILAKANFDKGISAVIGKDIITADKFGERQLSNGERQLHDCGIIYYPNSPYLMCIMTKGTDNSQLESIIQDITRKIHREILSRLNNNQGKK